MRVLVVGSGPAGRRHLQNALDLGHEVALVRREGLATDDVAAELRISVFAGLDAAESWGSDALVAADPPAAHLATVGWAVAHSLPVLVEKPLAPSPAGVAELLDEAVERAVRVEVGYNLRFHPALAAVAGAIEAGRIGRLIAVRAEVGSHLPDWHPELDYRSGSAARAELGGGAALALSHELDYVLWTAGSVVESAGYAVRASELEVDVDDVAELLLVHASGALSSVHMDLVDRSHRRVARWIGTLGTLEWSLGGPVALGAETIWDDPSFDLAATYVMELETFLAGRPFPGDALADACHVVEIVSAVERR